MEENNMKNFYVSDVTLKEVAQNSLITLSFREKVEIVNLLNKINIDVIELPEIKNIASDTLFIKTVAKSTDKSILTVPVEQTVDGVKNAAEALKDAKKSRLQVGVPVSTVQMEYMCHKKPKEVIELIAQIVSEASKYNKNVEFIPIDATRCDREFLIKAINTAIENGANIITLSDDAGYMLPNEFSIFVKEIKDILPKEIHLAIKCNNTIDMAVAASIASIISGADEIKVSSVSRDTTNMSSILQVLKVKGTELEIGSGVNLTNSQRVSEQISRIVDSKANSKNKVVLSVGETKDFTLNSFDNMSEVIKGIEKLGYDLSKEDCNNVYNEFKNIAEKKNVTAKDLEAIIASVALQVPKTFTLESYVINCGNIINSTANITVIKDGNKIRGVGTGDGPIDASFVAIEQIVGHHYELDDFQIQSVTEGREAVGHALIKIRNNGKLYAGTGISTDIIGASIRAYINALNKIIYEEV